MNTLEQMFPSLTLFSDMKWDQVSEEYEKDYKDLSFPEYLQQKALEGDCPPYLFELAFYELALANINDSTELFPTQKGIHLNPTSLFLSLEFDVLKMMSLAAHGKIEVHERQHVLCLFKDPQGQTQIIEISEQGLEILESLEDSPMKDKKFVNDSNLPLLADLINKGLILELV